MRALLILVVILIPAAPVAQARTQLVGADGAAQTLYQGFIDQALVPTADTRVVLHLEACTDEWRWCTSYRSGPVAIWADADYSYLWVLADRYSDHDRTVIKMAFMHEVGHVFDVSPGRKDYRRAFARLIGRSGEPWEWRVAGRDNSLFETFAMAYSYCAFYPHYADAVPAFNVWRGYGYSYAPTAERYERVCHVIRSARDGQVPVPSTGENRATAPTLVAPSADPSVWSAGHGT